jgi:hypothetical protein
VGTILNNCTEQSIKLQFMIKMAQSATTQWYLIAFQYRYFWREMTTYGICIMHLLICNSTDRIPLFERYGGVDV